MDMSEIVCIGSLVLLVVLLSFALLYSLFKPFQCPQCKRSRAAEKIGEHDHTFSYMKKIPDKWDTWNNRVTKWREVPASETVTTYTYECRYCGYRWYSKIAPIPRQFADVLLKCLIIACIYLCPCLGLFIGRDLMGSSGACWGALTGVLAAVGVAACLTYRFRLR